MGGAGARGKGVGVELANWGRDIGSVWGAVSKRCRGLVGDVSGNGETHRVAICSLHVI